MSPLTHWRGRPIATLSRDDLIRALTEAVRPAELPPMVRGTVYAPMPQRQAQTPAIKALGKERL